MNTNLSSKGQEVIPPECHVSKAIDSRVIGLLKGKITTEEFMALMREDKTLEH